MKGSLAGVVAVALVALVGGVLRAEATGGNSITSPDTAGNVGRYTSLALDGSGNPVVSYYDVTNGDLKVLHCGNPTCTSGNTIASPDGAGNVGSTSSLALDASGNPVVSYSDLTNFVLKLLHCGNGACTAGNSVAVPDTIGFWMTSLDLDVSGNPVVSYYTGSAMKVLHCGNGICTLGNTTVFVDENPGDVGAWTSMALDDSGNPVVSYYDITNGDLKVAHCGNATCTSGNTITAPDTPDDVGRFTSLVLDAIGNPVVSYYDMTNQDLKVLHCNDANCTGGGESITAPDTGAVGGYTSLALDASGNPVVIYSASSDLKVLHCNDVNCTGGDESITAPDTGVAGYGYTSVVLDGDGNPVVSYYDFANGDLKVLHCGDPNCSGAKPPVGGIAELPDVAGTPLAAADSSGPSAGVLAGIAAGAAVGAVVLGGAAWYVRRRQAGR